MADTRRPSWAGLINELSRNAASDHYRAQRSAIRAGNTLQTEYRAYSYVLPYLPEKCSENQRVALLRCAAIIAEYPNVFARGKTEFSAATQSEDEDAQGEDSGRGLSLGKWCQRLAHHPEVNQREPNDMIPSRLKYLHTQDVEEAIANIRRIIVFAQSKRIFVPLDPYRFTSVFWYWGNGYSDSSTRHRLSILRDFYSFDFDNSAETDHENNI
ncbi:type I-E CRISPR-associated protein Cse2/CasB [Corynebacterium poyangense]|uniref:Type I-E CRISPR-associated protein Cse2/CasB n=1 Tax=Corynebacterium poyangense TaxID=2684405 RepID=A0A7H0SQ66_9CORY|nr:type I-E CRISPR-associated protein Cse2/CasB [Corynebacterium poyangense]MBZ8178370.1 type I-E CRISPR-associated protein Cse2/CasB [Corynebacterium poyangense]QNQ90691.1 type I-E CRISPR-associated protein Cse2/CasB [Corynebacterium poyangense]